MEGRPGRRGPSRAAARAALALALALVPAPTATRAAGPGEAPAEAASPPPERPYGSSDLDRLRGESVPPDARGAETSAPDFGADSRDPGALRGRSKPLGEVSHPPRGRDPGAREDGADGAPGGPAPLRLRRRPDVAAPAERSLAERLCAAERDVTHARREQREAVRAYKRARREQYPRGGARALVVEHRALAARRLERAEAERAALAAEAEARSVDVESLACRRGP